MTWVHPNLVWGESSCDYYASPEGGGVGLSSSTAFKINDFWNVAGAGETLCLLDGTYTGADSMITPPKYLAGTAENPITIKALNDGNVTIDAQNKRRPVKLYYNDYFILEGFNAHSAFANGEDSASVVEVSRGNHNIVRRVVAWDAEDANANIFGTHHGDYNLFEDVAGFGIARKIFSSSYGGNHTTLRRTWGRWDGSHYAGPKMTYTMAYNNYHMLAENVIGTWSGEKMQSSYTLKCSSNNTYSKCGKTFSNYKVDQPYSIFGRDRLGKDLNANSKLLGSIAYVTQNDKFPPQTQYLINKLDSVELHNNVAWFEPGSYLGKNTFGLYGLSGGGGTNLIAEDLTGIGGTGMSVGQEWQTKNIVEGVDVSGVGNIFTDPSGAQICNRYQDGILTSEPLWPWPMNQRIIDGMVEAGRDPVDVTATIEGMFGTIPDECRWDKTGTAILSPDPTPDPITSINRTTTSFKTLAPITLDGNLAESAWSQSNAVTFRNTARSDNETTVHTLYDDTNLYFAFDVIDAQLEATGQALWKDDGNEIYMDVGHNASATVDGNDYHFIINKDDVNSGLVVMSKTVTSAKGYIMEVAIPWSSLGISAPSADQVMGLLLANNDMDNGKITQYDWQGLIETGGYRRPNLWGDLIFSAFTVGAPPIDYSPPVLIPGQSSCDFYAAPLGTGNGILETTPFKISDFWNVAGAGATLCLLDGTYTGKNSMIIPPSGFTGTEENPITVRALNDGKVLIDGQFVRQPVWISGVKWFVVEGINAAHSGPSGGRSVVLVSGGSEDIIIRRVIAWDTTATDNAHVFATNRAKRVLFEDVAGFGIGRKIFEPYKSDGVIFRRAWGKWEGSSAIGPRHTFSMSYHSVNTITENVIGTWDGSGSQLIGVFATNRLDPNDHPQGLKANNKLLGSIAYIDSGATYKAIGVTFINPDTIRDGDNFDHLELRDLVSYLPPGEFLDKRTIHLDKYTAGIPESLIASNLTSIGGSGTFIANGWTANNIEEGATVQDVSNIFTGTTGAKVCNQYVDGVLTSEALWPWPMNQRIIDAMKRSGRDPVDVTSTIESMFGAIPDECRWDGADPIDPIDRTTTSFKTLAPITLDGNLAESVWSESSAVTFSNAARSDNQTTVYTLYDDANLYFAFDVMDGQLEAPGVALWKDDGNEIYVDVGHNASTMIDGNDYHFIITKGDKISGPAVMSKTSPTATGYIMEIAIPWSSLGTSAPSAGQVMGLLLSNNDMDNGKIKQYDWQDLIETGGYRRPNLWGDLILSSQSVGNVPTDDGGIGVPVPDFTANVTSGAAPLAVQFTDTSSHSPTAWWWEFGDGATSPKQSPSHMYQSDGTYSIKFWAANAHGGNGDNDFVQKTGFITVNSSAGSGGGGDGGGGVPVPDFTANVTSGAAPLAVQFTDTSSNSPTTWWWEFGDGATSAEQSPSHVYQADGTYSVKLWAANAHGGNGANDFVQKTGFITVSLTGDVYYIAPDGADNNLGTSTTLPWGTFAHAMSKLLPGDTLYLMDGTYTGANKGTGTSAILHITVSGTTNQPIIIKAVNDGQAIIDGNNIRKTLLISNQSNLTLEGLIIKNSSWSSLEIGGVSDLVLRRISAYNGVGGFSIFGGSDNILIEDCIASGTGRLQYNIRKSKNVIVRRCWGRSQSEELGGAPFQIYGSDDGIIENSIGLGDSTKKNGTGLIVWCNSDNVSADRNKIYGNVMYGMKGSGYSDASKNHRTEDNTFLNNISINNKFGFSHRGDANLLVDKMTWAGTKNGIFALSEFPFDKPKDSDYEIYGNIKNSVFYSGTSGINFVDSSVVRGLDHDYNNFYDVTTNYIKTSPGAHERYIQPQYDEATYGKGAYLMRSSNLKGFGENGSDIGGEVIYRYENGVLTDKPLWPWPMEERIQKETKEILGQCMSATWEDAGNGCVGGLWKTLDGVYSGNPTPDPDPQPEPEPEPQPEPTVPLDKFITSLKSLSLISIDGHLAEDVWNQAKMVNFSNASRSDNQTTVYTLYDDTNLYFAFDVMDGQLEAPGVALWKDDGNEIYMDVGHNASATMDGNDYHFTITKDDLTAGPAVMSKTSPTATGYIMEIAIPWSSLGTSTPSAGQVMGLLLDNNDMDNGKSRQYDWQDLIESGGYGRPNVWGDLIFSALTVGTPPVVDPEPTPEPQPTTTGNLFQKHSTWYEKIPDNPVLNPNSAKYIAQQKSVSRFDRFIFSYGEWSMPIYYAKESDPLVTVNIKPCPARNEWAGTQRCKRIEYFGWNLKVPMNNTFRPAGDGATTFRDGHIAIISADKKTLYEIAQFKPSIMEAKLVKQFDLLSDGIQQPFSAEFDNAKGGNINVSPVARIHGLVTYDEVAAGVIPHAVSISLTGIVNAQDNRLNDNVYPAKTTNSGWTDSQWSPRLGHRFQLDPTLDLDDPKNFGGKPLSVGQKVIAKAMQEYGGIFIINDAPNGFNNIYLEDLEFDKSRSWSDKDVNIFGEGKMLLDHLRIIEPLKPPFANVPEPTPTPEPDPTPTPTPTPEPTPEPQPSATGNFFQKHSTWYEKIPANPVLNPDSQNYVSRINETAAGRRMTYSYREWSVPIYYATQDDPIVDFRCFEVGSNICNTMAYHDWNLNIPLPSNAKQAGWGDTGYRDGHMVIISPDRQFAWQFFRADVDNLKTSTVKKLDLSGDGIMQPLPVPYDYTSPMVANARVGRTPLLHGLVTYDEVKTGVIEHAIAYAYGGIGDQYALGRTNSVYPSEQNSALYASGWHDDQWSPKLGHRYQLDPTLDINDPADWGGLPLSAGQKVIAKAMQEYGIIYVENGGPRTSAVYLENVEYDDTRDWKALDVNIFGSGKILAKYFRLIEPLKPPFANAPEPTPEPTPNPTPEPTPEPQPSATGNFFQKHSTWYEKIPANPVLDPDSQKYMDQMMSVVPYSGLVYVYKDWSSTLYYAKESDPRVTINVKPCPDKYEWSGVQRCNRIEHFGWNLNVPMPAGAVPSGWNTGSFKDWHIFIISPDRKTLYDMAQFKPEKMEAKVIKQFDLTGDGIQQPMGDCQDPTNPHCTNASVSPVTRLHGMVTYEEVKSGVINHVLAMTLTGDVNSGNGTNRSVYPAETTNSGWTDSVWSPKLGHRFQLDPTLDLDDPNNFGGKALSIGEKVIAKALQVYGGIYMESGGDHNINLEDLEFDSTRSWSDKEVDIFGGGKIRFKDFSIIKPLKPPFVNTP